MLAAGAPDGRGVAVAVDGEVVPRGEWATTEVRDGQQVEVLHAVQGGGAVDARSRSPGARSSRGSSSAPAASATSR